MPRFYISTKTSFLTTCTKEFISTIGFILFSILLRCMSKFAHIDVCIPVVNTDILQTLLYGISHIMYGVLFSYVCQCSFRQAH